jgi:hypothetical protein
MAQLVQLLMVLITSVAPSTAAAAPGRGTCHTDDVCVQGTER